jgi:hypothetical protein
MHTQNTHSSVAAIVDSHSAATHPSTIPPAPASGVTLRAAIARTDSSNPSSALPCAAFWAGAEAAATLRPSQVLSVAADEVDWLYENTDDETDPECIQARATIESWLGELSFEHQLTIALHHDPTPWPEELRGSRRGDPSRTSGHEEDSFALILHALRPSTARDFQCYSPRQLELRARRRLELWIECKGPRVIDRVIRRARWQFEEAVRAYAEVRGRVPSVVPRASAAFRATEGACL